MTREQLEHAIRAAGAICGDRELYVVGSQAILASCPNAPAELRQSMEVDIAPKNRPELEAMIEGSIGEPEPHRRSLLAPPLTSCRARRSKQKGDAAHFPGANRAGLAERDLRARWVVRRNASQNLAEPAGRSRATLEPSTGAHIAVNSIQPSA